MGRDGEMGMIPPPFFFVKKPTTPVVRSTHLHKVSSPHTVTSTANTAASYASRRCNRLRVK